MQTNHYRLFLIMIGLHFIAMYILMYAMVNGLSNVFNSFNQLYIGRSDDRLDDPDRGAANEFHV